MEGIPSPYELEIQPKEGKEPPIVMSYTLPKHFESWKHEIAQKAAQKAQERGIEPKYIIAALMLESGINPEAVGDSGCSLGVLQLNKCVHGKEIATGEQVDLWLDNFQKYYEESGSWERAVQSWNAPALKNWGATRYFKAYKESLKLIAI